VSGPFAESAPLHVRTSVEVSLWPLTLWCDQGQAAIECAACDDGMIFTARSAPVPLLLADLTARVEAHIRRCRAVRVCEG
jgi:hypothetical protein